MDRRLPGPRLPPAGLRAPTATRSEIEAVLRATRGRVDGLIVMAPDVDTGLVARDLPDVAPRRRSQLPAGEPGVFDSISIDNYGGAVAMVRHLAGARAPPDRAGQGTGHATTTPASGCAATSDADARRRHGGRSDARDRGRLHRGRRGHRAGARRRSRSSRGRRRSSPPTTTWPSACSARAARGRVDVPRRHRCRRVRRHPGRALRLARRSPRSTSPSPELGARAMERLLLAHRARQERHAAPPRDCCRPPWSSAAVVRRRAELTRSSPHLAGPERPSET